MAVAIPIIVIIAVARSRRSWCSRTGAAAPPARCHARRASATRRSSRRRSRRHRRRPSSRRPDASAPTRRAPTYENVPAPARRPRRGDLGAGRRGRARRHPPAVPQPRPPRRRSASRLAGFGAACLGFLWPTGSGGFGGKVSAGKVSDIVDGDPRQKQPVLRSRGARLHRASTRRTTCPAAKKVYEPDHVRRDGRGVRRAVPAVRAPRLPCPVVPDVAVVRMPLPRLEVQPGRREEGRPGAAWPRPLRDQRRRRQAHHRHRASSRSGPPIGTDTTGAATGRPALRLTRTHRRWPRRWMPRGAWSMTVRPRSHRAQHRRGALRSSGISDLGGAVAQARTRESCPRTCTPFFPTRSSRAGASNVCRAGRCCSPRSWRRAAALLVARAGPPERPIDCFDENAVERGEVLYAERDRWPQYNSACRSRAPICHGAEGGGGPVPWTRRRRAGDLAGAGAQHRAAALQRGPGCVNSTTAATLHVQRSPTSSPRPARHADAGWGVDGGGPRTTSRSRTSSRTCTRSRSRRRRPRRRRPGGCSTTARGSPPRTSRTPRTSSPPTRRRWRHRERRRRRRSPRPTRPTPSSRPSARRSSRRSPTIPGNVGSQTGGRVRRSS